jgi:hypothetical protein
MFSWNVCIFAPDSLEFGPLRISGTLHARKYEPGSPNSRNRGLRAARGLDPLFLALGGYDHTARILLPSNFGAMTILRPISRLKQSYALRVLGIG